MKSVELNLKDQFTFNETNVKVSNLGIDNIELKSSGNVRVYGEGDSSGSDGGSSGGGDSSGDD